MTRSLFFGFIVVFFFTTGLFAQIPRTISYQGVLTDASAVVVPDGNYTLNLSLYDVAAGGTRSWYEQQVVMTSKGVFNVLLGAVNPIKLLFDKPLWLNVSVNTGPDLTPRIQLASAPTAIRAQRRHCE